MAFGRGDLLRKLNGKRIQLTTHCGLYREYQGQVKDVFDDFFIFMTAGSSGALNQKNMVMFENIAIIRQLPEVETEEIAIVR